MSKKQISVRVSPRTIEFIQRLKSRYGETQSSVVARAVEIYHSWSEPLRQPEYRAMVSPRKEEGKKLITIRVSPYTAQQLAELRSMYGENQTTVVTAAVERLYSNMFPSEWDRLCLEEEAQEN